MPMWLAVMMMILIFINSVSIFMITNKMISDSPMVKMIETVILMVVIMAFMMANTDINNKPNTMCNGNKNNYKIINKTMLLSNLVGLVTVYLLLTLAVVHHLQSSSSG